jgi:hypothetical protein
MAQRDIDDGTDAVPQSPTTGENDFRELADPEFLAERKRVREALESAPEQSPARAGLIERYDAMNDEFDRRASRAWTGAS